MWKYWVFISNTPSHRRSHHLVELSTGWINIARQFQFTSHYNASKAFMGTNPFVASYKSTTPFHQTHHHVPSQYQECFTQIVSSNLNWCPLLTCHSPQHMLGCCVSVVSERLFPISAKAPTLVHRHASERHEGKSFYIQKEKENKHIGLKLWQMGTWALYKYPPSPLSYVSCCTEQRLKFLCTWFLRACSKLPTATL